MINETDILLNNEIKVTFGQFRGQTGIVTKVMADGRSLEVMLANRNKADDRVFIDVTFVREIIEPAPHAKGEPDLGPIANSVVQDHK